MEDTAFIIVSLLHHDSLPLFSFHDHMKRGGGGGVKRYGNCFKYHSRIEAFKTQIGTVQCCADTCTKKREAKILPFEPLEKFLKRYIK